MKRFLTLFLALLAFTSCTRIDAGMEGLKVDQFGNDKGDPAPIEVKGTVFYNPFTQNVYEYAISMQHISYTALTFTTVDGAIFHAEPTFNYRMKQGKAVAVFMKYRKDMESIENTFLLSAIQDCYVRAGNRYTSDSLMSHRGQFEDMLLKELDSKVGDNFELSQLVSNLAPPQSLVDAIALKNKMVQDAMAKENEVRKETAAAQVKVAKATGDANSLRIQADADAYANKVRQVSLTPLLIQQQFLSVWDGKLPVYGNTPQLFKDITK